MKWYVDNMHQNNIVKIDFKDVDLFDWNGLAKDLKELAVEEYSLMMIFDHADIWIVRERSNRGRCCDVAVLFGFTFNGMSYQFSFKITNFGFQFFIVDKLYVLGRLFKLANNSARDIIREHHAPK